MVKTELHQDYAFMACCGASIVGDSRDNKVMMVMKLSSINITIILEL